MLSMFQSDYKVVTIHTLLSRGTFMWGVSAGRLLKQK